jgi:hypothetical protein
MSRFTITEQVPASNIWPEAKNYVDNGQKDGYLRGYNVEVTTRKGTLDWMSCVWVRDIATYVEDPFTKLWYQDLGVVPTGRVSFRGYGMEKYDYIEHDTVIVGICQL